MKALLGAATLQGAMVVTSTDWSSNGNRPLAVCVCVFGGQGPQPIVGRPGPLPSGNWVGAQIPGRAALPCGVKGRLWRQVQS